MASRERRNVIERVFFLFGCLFGLQWAITQLLFPVYKNRPIGFLPLAAGLAFGGLLSLPSIRQKITEWLLRASRMRFLVLAGMVALALRLAAVSLFPLAPIGDPQTFHCYARNLVEGKGYGEQAYRAFFPPGMSFLLSVCYTLTGVSPLAGKILNTLFGTGMVLLVYDVGRRTVGEAAARWAVCLTTFMPTLVIYCACLGYEIVLGTILLAVVDLAVILANSKSRSAELRLALFCGLLLGFGCLIKPICLLVPVLLPGYWLLLGKRAWAFAWTGVAASCMLLVILPWTLRNYEVFGEFVLISTNGGAVLYNANNPESQGLWMETGPLPGEVDELSRDRIRGKAAVKWMLGDPGRWLELAAAKCVYTWGTSSTIMSIVSADRIPPWQEQICMGAINVFWSALLLWYALATLLTSVWDQRLLYLVYFLLAYVWFLHLFYEALSRHHIPVLFALILVGSVWLSGDFRKSGEVPKPSG